MLTNQQYTCLVKKYIDSLFRLALSHTKNPTDAEDVVQNVFLKLLQQKRDFESEEHVRNWLIRVTVNECKKWHRSPWRRHLSFEDGCADLPNTTGRDREVLQAIMDLPVKYRTVIYLYYYEGYSTQQIAQALGIAKGTVCVRLSRAREMLRVELQEVEEYA